MKIIIHVQICCYCRVDILTVQSCCCFLKFAGIRRQDIHKNISTTISYWAYLTIPFALYCMQQVPLYTFHTLLSLIISLPFLFVIFLETLIKICLYALFTISSFFILPLISKISCMYICP